MEKGLGLRVKGEGDTAWAKGFRLKVKGSNFACSYDLRV